MTVFKDTQFQNIFPLAKVSFAKAKMLGAGRHPTGPEWRIYVNICETRLYFEFTATNRMSGKNLWDEIFGPKVGKVGYF